MILTRGNVSRAKALPVGLKRAISTRSLLGDKGDGWDSLRGSLWSERRSKCLGGATASSRYAAIRCKKDRNLFENIFHQVKYFRRVATRYDELAVNFPSAPLLAKTLPFRL